MFNRKIRGIEECEAIVLRAFLIASILGSIGTVMFFMHSGKSMMGTMGHLINIVLSLVIMISYRFSKNKYAIIRIFAIYYFFALFSGAWAVLSFRHPIVLIYIIVVFIINILLLKGKDLKYLGITELFILASMLYYDMMVRNTFYESSDMGKLVGVSIVFFTICFVITIYKQFINTKIFELEEYSFIDPLTKAKNSRAFADDFDVAMGHWERDQLTFSLINIDIDDFKRINDTFGHQIGDDVLREMVEKVTGIMRDGESIYRNGGDEFLVILSGSNHIDAGHFVKRLPSYHNVSTDFDISLSYGIADVSECKDKRSLMTLADERMYQFKTGKMQTEKGGTIIFRPEECLVPN